MVFTSKPVPNVDCKYIATPNIEGDNTKSQYIADKIHVMGPNYIVTEYEKGLPFYVKNKEKLEPFMEKLA